MKILLIFRFFYYIWFIDSENLYFIFILKEKNDKVLIFHIGKSLRKFDLDWESLIEIEQSLPTAYVKKDRILKKNGKRIKKRKRSIYFFMTSFYCFKVYNGGGLKFS